MSELKEPKPVRLITTIIYKPDSGLEDCIESLRERYGDIDYMSDVLTTNLNGESLL